MGTAGSVASRLSNAMPLAGPAKAGGSNPFRFGPSSALWRPQQLHLATPAGLEPATYRLASHFGFRRRPCPLHGRGRSWSGPSLRHGPRRGRQAPAVWSLHLPGPERGPGLARDCQARCRAQGSPSLTGSTSAVSGGALLVLRRRLLYPTELWGRAADDTNAGRRKARALPWTRTRKSGSKTPLFSKSLSLGPGQAGLPPRTLNASSSRRRPKRKLSA